MRLSGRLFMTEAFADADSLLSERQRLVAELAKIDQAGYNPPAAG